MKKEQHEAIVKGLLIQEQERFDKYAIKRDQEFAQMVEKYEGKLAESGEIMYDWRFISICVLLAASIFFGVWQLTINRDHRQTIQQLEHYSIVVRVAKTMGGIEANDIHRILRDLQNQSGDTTRLLHEVYRRIQEFDSGEATIQRVQTQNRTP
ncbi:MAG: hypothetical protein FWC10_00820 [Lentimicrobiaceae bacterium]|nr:hypothetical protein [Lentimicrobiaceae bacterium]